MATTASIESMLVVDCGSTTTRAVLVDLVDGRYRFVARGEAASTISCAERDLMVGVRSAIRQVEEVTGRSFLNPNGQLITPEQTGGAGVDMLLAVSNAGEPLRVIVAGLSDQISVASARHAIDATYALVEHVVSPAVEGNQARTAEETLSLIQTTEPDVIVLTGGTDGGPTQAVADLTELVSLGCALIQGPARPQILYAGNSDFRTQVADIVGDTAQLLVLDNVRPTLDRENLEPLSGELSNFYQERKLLVLPGFETLKSWSTAPVMTSSRAFGYVVKYLAQMWGPGHGVLGCDLGGSVTTLASVVDQKFSLIIRSDLGMSYNIANVLAQTGLANIVRWLPFELSDESARDRILTKQLHPTSIPSTPEDLYLEQAVAREALRLTLDEAGRRWRATGDGDRPQFEAIVGSGGLFTHTQQHGQVILALLDAIQPIGVATLWLDETSLGVPVGAIAAVNPLAAAHVMEGDAFINLGTVVCPVGEAKPGEIILRLTITYSDRRVLDVEIGWGSLEVIPLPLGEQASLELRPLKGFNLGAGPGKKRVIKRLVGGMMGLIVDARGRPIVLPADPAQRLEKVKRWYQDIGA
jgi:uncharacterized protein (TIGR01319 family)